MFKRTALIALAAAVIGYAAMPHTAEAAGYKSSRSSSFSSSRSSYNSYSRPKAIAPARSATPYSRPAQITRSMPSVAPVRRPTASTPYRGQSATDGYRKPVTPYGNRSAYRAPARQVSSPLASRNSYAPRNTTIINRNYYGGNSNFGSYGRGHYGGGYGGGMMGGGGPGLGSMLLAGAGGAIVGNMLYNSFHTPSASGGTTRTTDTVTPVQADEIRQEQRIEDKLDQVNDKLDNMPAPAGPQGYSLPADAPLMMSPDFYKLGGQM